jgi:hypothetical protein
MTKQQMIATIGQIQGPQTGIAILESNNYKRDRTHARPICL